MEKEIIHQEAFYEHPTFWVAVAFAILVVSAAKPLWKMATAALDKRAAQIRYDLEEAARLHQEAKQILESYQQKQQQAVQEAESIIQQTKADAQAMAERAEAELKTSLDKRHAMAVQRIEQAETKAVQMVQQHVVDIAINAARHLIAEQISQGNAAEMLALATRDVERKLH
jgi:F-type H+-transporting ATPase subunit b